MNTSKYTRKTIIQFHSKLKTQFLKIHDLPFSDFEFRKMRNLLLDAGVDEEELSAYFDDSDEFNIKKLPSFLQLSENTIVRTHLLISKWLK